MKILISICLILVLGMVFCSFLKKEHKLIICFYNLENLFDLYDDPNNTFDDEYLPDSNKQWNQKKFNTKLEKLEKVLSAIGNGSIPDIIGVSEIENESVLQSIIASWGKAGEKFDYIHYEGNDQRGLDVALIYNTEIMKVNASKSFPVRLPHPFSHESTRDILAVNGTINNERTSIYINHWSSRRGGTEASAPKRKAAGQLLKDIITADGNKHVIILGDLNDEPVSASVKKSLGAHTEYKKIKENRLYNLSYPLFNQKKGTYNYKGKWNMLDQAIVSGSLLQKNAKLSTKVEDFNIYSDHWMMYNDKKHGLRPSRTYGHKYYGGVSDHLPVYFTIYLN